MTQSWARGGARVEWVGGDVGRDPAVETPGSLSEGWWRHAGVLDRLRLRHIPAVARASVLSDSDLATGSLVIVTVPGAQELWARVLDCRRASNGLYTCTLGLLGSHPS